jgi:hypothetical protein
MLYFLAIWSGTTHRVKHLTRKIRNFFWADTIQRVRARVAWQTCCLKKADGGLNMIDLVEAVVALMAKWIITASELGVSNFKSLLRYRLSNFQPPGKGTWKPNLDWFLLSGHRAPTGFHVWQCTKAIWKQLLPDLQVREPQSYEEWVAANFWWTPAIPAIGPIFSQVHAVVLHRRGLQRIRDVWIEEEH